MNQFTNDYSKFYDLFNQDKPYQKEIEFVYRWANKPKRIFDIGCGTASYWKYYPPITYLLGVDKSASMAPITQNIICADITTYKHKGQFDCSTALFDVLNYMPRHDWWKDLPIKKGGYFIFDIWDKQKVLRDGFKRTMKQVGNLVREINTFQVCDDYVDLDISIKEFRFDLTCEAGWYEQICHERHRMYFHSTGDINDYCGKEFKIEEIKRTKSWQTWYKCKRK